MLLSFETPKKIRSTEEHNKMHTSDSGVAGTYVPNMSQADRERWKAKHIKGDNERIEIRKSFPMAQIVIVVRKNPPIPAPPMWKGEYTPEKSRAYDEARHKHHEQLNNIKISMNGSLWISFADWQQMEIVIQEACEILDIPYW